MNLLSPFGWLCLLALSSHASTQAGPSGPANPIKPDQSMQNIQIMHSGAVPAAEADTNHFTGTAHVISMFKPEWPSRAGGGLVIFEAGARTAWHTHPLGQTLIVTEGTGWVQQWESLLSLSAKEMSFTFHQASSIGMAPPRHLR